MKNTKLHTILAGLIAMLFGISMKSTDSFTIKLENSVKIDSQKYLAGSECSSGGTVKPPPQRGKVG